MGLRNFKNIWVRSKDGEEINGWFFESKETSEYLVIHFHGNAQNMSSHYLNLAWMIQYGVDLLAFDYRGYGVSTGKPTQEGTINDGLAILEWASEQKKKKKYKKLIVFGQSLGGAIAMASLAQYKNQKDIDLIVIDSSFTSYKSVAQSAMKQNWFTFPLIPLSYFVVSDEMAPKNFFNQLKTEALIVHGSKDKVVPYRHGKKVFNLYQGPKTFWALEGAKHTQIFHGQFQTYRHKFLNFIK